MARSASQRENLTFSLEVRNCSVRPGFCTQEVAGARRQNFLGHRIGGGDAQAPDRTRQAFADPADLGDMRGHGLDMREHHLALPGRLAHAVDGLEQPQPKRALDARQPPPDRGLVDTQPRAGAGIGALVSDRGDDAQIVPVHVPIVSRAPRRPAISQPSAAISLRESRPIARYIGTETISNREISDIMTAPKTLLELAGADLKPPRLREACLVLIDLQNEYLAGPLALPDAQERDRERRQGCWRGRGRTAPRSSTSPTRAVPADCSIARPNAAPSSSELAPLAGEPVIEKGLPNAFAGTDLQAQLAATERKDIILAGFMTHMCISSTARAGLDLGYRITVDADSCATRDLPDGRGGKYRGCDHSRSRARRAVGPVCDHRPRRRRADLIGKAVPF